MRKLLLLVATLATVFCSHSQSSPRKKINIDDNWKFSFGHAADPKKDFNYGIVTIFAKTGAARGTAIDPRFNDSTWRNLDLPHDWAVELPFVEVNNRDVESHGYKPVGGLFPETSIGWYRKHFNISKNDSGQRFQIQFDGVFRNASFWVNGFYLGNNLSGYIGTTYDVTDFLNYDRENVLVVRVDASQYEGWFYEGAGIYRHVWLNQYDPLHFNHDGVFIYSKVTGNKATVTVESEILNQNVSDQKFSVSTYVTDRDGKILGKAGDQNSTLALNGSTIVKQNISVTNPNLGQPTILICTG